MCVCVCVCVCVCARACVCFSVMYRPKKEHMARNVKNHDRPFFAGGDWIILTIYLETNSCIFIVFFLLLLLFRHNLTRTPRLDQSVIFRLTSTLPACQCVWKEIQKVPVQEHQQDWLWKTFRTMSFSSLVESLKRVVQLVLRESSRLETFRWGAMCLVSDVSFPAPSDLSVSGLSV